MKLSTPKKSFMGKDHLIFFLSILVICIGILILVYDQQHYSIPPKHEKVTVHPGESVWNIVIREYPDIPNVWDGIDAIKKQNGITDFSKVRAGFTLYLPIVK